MHVVARPQSGKDEWMWIRPSAMSLLLLFSVQPAAAQQPEPNVQIIAQAYDRCMATYAVRLTRTAATDQDIFRQASQGCLSLGGQLRAAIEAQLPPEQAAELLRSMDAQAEPNFMAMLARIRSDRSRNQ